jgi:hypothetical protein
MCSWYRPQQSILVHFLLFLLFGALLTTSLSAQTGQPFQQLEIGAQYSLNTNHNEFHQYWQSQDAWHFYTSSPFYWGQIQVGIHYQPFSAINAESNFQNIYIYSAWGVQLELPLQLRWFNSLGFGTVIMHFNAENSPHLRYENELAISFHTNMTVPIFRGFTVNLAAWHQIIYTYKQIGLSYLSIGCSFRLNTPKFIKNILQ